MTADGGPACGAVRATRAGVLASAAVGQLVLHVLLESRCDEVLSGRQGLLDHLAAVPTGRILLAHG